MSFIKDYIAAIIAGQGNGGGSGTPGTGTVTSVNGVGPDANGNVKIETGSNVDELDALAALMDTGVVAPMADETGAVYVDDTGNIYSF